MTHPDENSSAPEPVTKKQGEHCSNHTAVQRRRDQLMLAGQSLPLVGEFPAIAAKAGLEATEEMLADYALRIADAILKRAEEEVSEPDLRRQRDVLLRAAQESVDQLSKLYEGRPGFIASNSDLSEPSGSRDVPAVVERLRAAISDTENTNAKS